MLFLGSQIDKSMFKCFLIWTEARVSGRKTSTIVDTQMVELKSEIVEIVIVLIDLMGFYPE